ncbi:OmpA family protein [Vibrio sp. Of7-15]|uniref:flagellar protein MotY n=1 Tax=Vibrio sp. Of7-15 TaxID=2724879 RepID=UPI001EF265C9|nr:OmpA family protein [Vibrio sp. Of7-15]MCG7495895.1 OmpA family protein [Vibrio sp. Of7-15]
MKKATIYTALFVSGMFANTAMAATKHYVAKPDQSQWRMTVDTPLECRLVHSIPNYGNALFTSRASKKINLDFELKMRLPMGETRNVNLISMPPKWMPGEAADAMTTLKFFKQFDGYIGGQTAWGMLSELEDGRYPTFSYSDWHNRDRLIEVSLSSVLFQQPYNDFSACVDNLLPYSFEDIAFTILHYDRNSDQLNKASQKRLAQIAEFVRYSDDIDLVLVATYTDSSGGKNLNQHLSDKRAKVLQDYFKSLGMPQDRIQVQGYGKRRPIADNGTPIGKDKNRRVVISLGRTII